MNEVDWQIDLPQLQQFRLFRQVPADVLSKLLNTFRAFDLEAGEILLSPHTVNQHLSLVLSGSFKVYLGSLENPEVSALSPGDCAGEISFIDHQPPSAFVVAAESCRVLRLHRQSLFEAFNHSNQLMQNLLELMCQRVRNGNRLILDSEQNANLDTLTGAFNRRWLEHVFERESNRCIFAAQPLALMMLDVDHFKKYNDRHGHLAGDYALCLVAHTLRNQLRGKDSLIRYGGEEFVIVLPELNDTESLALGERLRLSLEHIQSFYSPVGVLPGVTMSIGLAMLEPDNTLEALIARADQALYRAKSQGRNTVSR